MARDPLDRITELCQLHPEGVLTKIAEVLGCGDADIANMLHAARNSAFEAAAQVCDAERERLLGVGGTGFDTASNLGRRIRKLKVDAPGVTGAPDQTFSHQTPMERP